MAHRNKVAAQQLAQSRGKKHRCWRVCFYQLVKPKVRAAAVAAAARRFYRLPPPRALLAPQPLLKLRLLIPLCRRILGGHAET